MKICFHSLSKSKFFTRVAIVSHSCSSCLALVLTTSYLIKKKASCKAANWCGDQQDITNRITALKKLRKVLHRCSTKLSYRFRKTPKKTPVLESLFNAVASLKTATVLKHYSSTGVFLWINRNFKNANTSELECFKVNRWYQQFFSFNFFSFYSLPFLKMISRITILSNQMENFCF